jgi:hypothetical protein
MHGVPAVPADLVPSLDALRADLSAIFGPRLRAIVAYGSCLSASAPAARRGTRVPLNTLALVDVPTYEDLQACAPRADAWQRSGLAVPLLLGEREFRRSLDVFPFEYGDIIARHVAIAGDDPFSGLSVGPNDLRRECEAHAKGHLIHLREGYLDAQGRGRDVADLLTASAGPFATLLGHVARLRHRDGGSAESVNAAVNDLPGADGSAVRTLEHLVEFLDAWTLDEPT